MHRKNILILTGIFATVAMASAFSLIKYPSPHEHEQVETRNISLGELANSKPIYPQVTIIRDKVTSVNGTALTELSKSSTSVTIESVNGILNPITKDGQAELTL